MNTNLVLFEFIVFFIIISSPIWGILILSKLSKHLNNSGGLELKMTGTEKDPRYLCKFCKSENIRLVSVYDKEIMKERKKVTYKANLNPLKPFTAYNVKESTITPQITKKMGIYQCESCHKTFERKI